MSNAKKYIKRKLLRTLVNTVFILIWMITGLVLSNGSEGGSIGYIMLVILAIGEAYIFLGNEHTRYEDIVY